MVNTSVRDFPFPLRNQSLGTSPLMHLYALIPQAVSSFQVALKGIKVANSEGDHGTLPLGLTGF